MKILFGSDSLYAEVPKKLLSKGLNAKILKVSIPGSTTMELGLAIVYRVRAMVKPPKIVLLSVGTNDAKSPTEKFYREIITILEFCVNLKMQLLRLQLTIHAKIPFFR